MSNSRYFRMFGAFLALVLAIPNIVIADELSQGEEESIAAAVSAAEDGFSGEGSIAFDGGAGEQAVPGDAPIQASSAVDLTLPWDPGDVWASADGAAIFYQTTYDLRKIDLATQTETILEYVGRPKVSFWQNGTMYYVVSDSQNNIQLYALDAATGTNTLILSYTREEAAERFGYASNTLSVSAGLLAVNPNGEIFLSVTTVYNTSKVLASELCVYDAQGYLKATLPDFDGMTEILCFDGQNGNFYYTDSCHLYVGNYDGESIHVSENHITAMAKYINGWGYLRHIARAEMLGGRYLAVLRDYSDDNRVYLLDSHAIRYDEVEEQDSYLDPTTFQVFTRDINLPVEDVLGSLPTYASDEHTRNYTDLTSVGSRAVYRASDGVVFVMTAPDEVTAYTLDGLETIGSCKTSHRVYRLVTVGDDIYAIERDKGDEGNYHWERLDLSVATSLSIVGPDAIEAASQADYTATGNGAIAPVVTFESSDPSVLSIDALGHAATWKAGTVTVTASSANGVKATKVVTVRASDFQRTYADVTTLDGEVIDNLGDHDYRQWTSPTRSYLAETSDGLMRVQARDEDVLVEWYAPDGELSKTKSVPFELPIFGGFLASSDGSYYLAFGKENPSESNSETVLSVVHYDSSWARLGVAELKGGNTRIPFDAGSLSMAETEGRLFVHTCHAMYKTDGEVHQANMTLAIDKSTMAVTSQNTAVSNPMYGYTSHSFNQFVRTDGNRLLRVDHGDYALRGIVLSSVPADGAVNARATYGQVARFDGTTSQNYTGASVGGFELSDCRGLVAFNQDLEFRSAPRNVRLAVANVYGEGKTEVVDVTSYGTGSSVTCQTPQLVRIDGRHFLLMWIETDSSAGTRRMAMVQVDHTGQVVSGIVRRELPASDCQPIVLSDGRVGWYVSGSKAVRLYAVNPFDLESMTDDDVSQIDGPLDIGTATFSQISAQTYSGSSFTPKPTLTLGGKALVEGTDYTLSYASNVDAGTATIKATGMGAFTGTAQTTFSILPASIAGATLTVADQDWTGSALEPAPTVVLGGRTLVRSRDYEVSYANNTAVGVATVTIAGKGNYTGTASGQFTIKDNTVHVTGLSLSESDITVEYGSSNVALYAYLEPGDATNRRVTWSSSDPSVANLSWYSGTVYSWNFNEVKFNKVGTATITCTTAEGGLSASCTVTVTPALIEDCSVEVTGGRYSVFIDDVKLRVFEYTGRAIAPTVSVKDGPYVTLQEGVDYTVSYGNNTNPGMATVLLTGLGNYSGTRTVPFQIEWPFVDVDMSTYHWEDILWMYTSGVSQGWYDERTGTRTYRPMDNVARCDMAAFLYRLAGSPAYEPTASDRARFKDVSDSTPHAYEIWWMASVGISTGYADGTFRPYGNIVRCDMAAFLFRLARLQGAVNDSWSPTSDQLRAFSDVSPSTDHYREVLWMASSGVSTGYPDGTFRPYGKVVRCDMAAFLHRMDTSDLV